MDLFVKGAAGALVAVVLIVTISKQGKDISLLLTITVCCLLLFAAFSYLKPVVDFLDQLQAIGNLDADIFKVLFKAAGIGLLAEFTGLICNDAGNASLGKATQLMATAAILWISIPLMNKLIEMIDNILGAL